MSKIEYKERLLISAVSAELGKASPKTQYWLQEKMPGGTEWESGKVLSLAKTLEMIDPERDEMTDPDLITLYCLGWEFNWCKVPPKLVLQKRSELLSKIHSGNEITELERIWYQVILIDPEII